MGKRKKHDEPVSLPNAHLSGREYAEDRPDNCRDCFFWKKSIGSCTRYECFFLRPLRKKIEERFDENGKLILDCRICPYNRVSPCIGYCIAALRREVSAAYEDRQGSA